MLSNISLDILSVTEVGAIAAAKLLGHGDKEKIDLVATEAIRNRLNDIDFLGKIVISEYEKDASHGLLFDECVGRNRRLLVEDSFGNHPYTDIYYDIAVDVVDGSYQTSLGGNEAVSALVVGEKDSLFSSREYYMKKLAFSNEIRNSIGQMFMIEDSLERIVRLISIGLDKPVEHVTACLLNRPRHEKLIAELRQTGCRVKLIPDCDVSAVLASGIPNSGIDFYLGIGGVTEGVINAACLKCMNGFMQCQLCDKEGNPKGHVYTLHDLVKGDVIVSITGITKGSVLDGVKFNSAGATTHSLLMQFSDKNRNLKWVKTEHIL